MNATTDNVSESTVLNLSESELHDMVSAERELGQLWCIGEDDDTVEHAAARHGLDELCRTGPYLVTVDCCGRYMIVTDINGPVCAPVTVDAALVVVELRGGDASEAPDAIWIDTEDVRTDTWRAVVYGREAADDLAHNCGAELVSVYPWDGSEFGDGNCGTIEADLKRRVIYTPHAMFVDAPCGWTVEATK